MRVRWEGVQVTPNVFDTRERVIAVLEFDRSMEKPFQNIKGTEFAVLVPKETGEFGSQRAQPEAVKPSDVSMDPYDPSTLML